MQTNCIGQRFLYLSFKRFLGLAIIILSSQCTTVSHRSHFSVHRFRQQHTYAQKVAVVERCIDSFYEHYSADLWEPCIGCMDRFNHRRIKIERQRWQDKNGRERVETPIRSFERRYFSRWVADEEIIITISVNLSHLRARHQELGIKPGVHVDCRYLSSAYDHLDLRRQRTKRCVTDVWSTFSNCLNAHFGER